MTDSDLGVVTETNDPTGALTRQSLRLGLSQWFTRDCNGDTTGTSWADECGNVFLADAQASDVHGRWRSESLSSALIGYGYNRAVW